MASQVVLVVKNLPGNAGDIRDVGSIPGWGRSPGGRHGNPFQYSSLENPMDRRAWQATVHWVTKSQTQLKQLSMQADIYIFWPHYVSCGILALRPGVEYMSPTLEARSLNYWTAREVLPFLILSMV